MRFSDWFSKQATTQKAFAEIVGVTQGRISHLLKGGIPSMDLAHAIERASHGAVTPNDWRPRAAKTGRKKAA